MAMAPAPTPTPMPAFAPVPRSDELVEAAVEGASAVVTARSLGAVKVVETVVEAAGREVNVIEKFETGASSNRMSGE